MFTLGHKALVLNKDRSEDTIDATQCTILGFCNFAIADAIPNTAINIPPSTGVLATSDFTVPTLVNEAAATIEVEIVFKQNRYVSEYSSDFIRQGDSVIFQSTPLAANSADTANVLAIVNGFTQAFGDGTSQGVFNIGDWPPLTVTAGTAPTDINIAMTENYLNIDSVSYRVIPAANKVVPAVKLPLVPLTPATLVGNEGNGQGKFLEESFRTASYTNMDPYANRPHGSDSVDIRGQYVEYDFTATDNGGWQPHAHLGTAIADQDVTSKGQKFTIYVHTDATATIAGLDAWTGAVGLIP